MNPEQLQQILDNHKKWIRSQEGGSRANLRSANLYGANLRSANLNRADLYGANLRSANLNRADLYGANLYGADLRSADLRSANLYGADLRSADLSGADLPYKIIQIGPIGSRRDYLIYKTQIDEITAGCFRGTLDEFTAAVEKTHGDNQYGQEYRLAIAMLRGIVAMNQVQR